MTKSEALKKMQEVKAYMTSGNPIWSVTEIGEAFDLAIEALEQPDLQPTCDQLATDCISRQDAVSRFSDLLMIELRGERLPTWEEVYNAIKELPSAQPDSSACWGCNCPKMEQKIFSEMVHLHDAERRTDEQTD